MAGYISLFFDDARSSLPNIKLEQSKQNIFSNYKKVLRRPDIETERNLRDMLENTVLKTMESQMKRTNKPPAKNIDYWNINLAQMYSLWDKNLDQLEQASKAIEYVEQIYNNLSRAISKSDGKISKKLVADMEDDKEKLDSIRKKMDNFNPATSKKSFKDSFFGSLQSAVMKAQGHTHEAAGMIAAVEAKKLGNKELKKFNEDLSLIIEHSGGHLVQDSKLAKAVEASNMELGISSNPKNDITVAVKDGNGKIIWYTGLSLKSTSAAEPKMVKIMSQSLSTLLNKVYDTNTYLNYAAALGIGDWKDKRTDIGAIADRMRITTSGSVLAETWKQIIYDAIYLQIIDMFTGIGTGGVLNNAEYLIINSKPISIYKIFEILESKQKTNNLTSIQGLEIKGVRGAKGAMNRHLYTNENINAFVKDVDHNIMTTDTERILRSSQAWDDVYNSLQNKKITISLKYRDMIGGKTK